MNDKVRPRPIRVLVVQMVQKMVLLTEAPAVLVVHLTKALAALMATHQDALLQVSEPSLPTPMSEVLL
jgi:hypothetical protein